MRTLSSLLPGAAMFVAALTVNAATVCQGEILNPVTDVCWSCVFPVKIGGKASLSSFSRRSLTTGVWTSRRSTSPTCPNLIPYGTTRSRASS